MKRIFLLSLVIAAYSFAAKAVDYTFDYKGASYDYNDYFAQSDVYLQSIQESAVVNGVFHLPYKVNVFNGKVAEVTKVKLWEFPSSIKKFTVNADNPYFTAVDGVIFSKDMTRLVAVPHAKSLNFTIPSSVRVIGAGAFAGSDMTKIVIPEGVTSIEDNAFNHCTKLKKVSVPSTLTHVGVSAFEDTPFMESLPKGMNYLGKVAFTYVGTMPQNSTLDIREGTVEIAERAVCDQDGLVAVKVPLSVKRICRSAFENCENILSIATLSSDCHVEVMALADAKSWLQVKFEGDRSRYCQPGDNIVCASGFKMMQGIDTPPKFKSIVEMNKLYPNSENLNPEICEIRLNEGGITMSDYDKSSPKQTFSNFFGHEANKVYNLRTSFYKNALAAAKKLYGIYYVRFHIDKTGKVSNVTVPMISTPKPNKDAVVRLVNSLPPFEPARLNGKPVAVWVNVLVTAEPIVGGFLYTYPD